MSLKVKKGNGTPIPPMDPGTYPAVCVGVIDLGEQYSEKFKKFTPKVMLMWELPSVRVTVDDKDAPRILSKDFSASINEKSSLSQFLIPWRGKSFTDEELNGDGFDLTSMLGQGCFLQVIIKEGEKSTYNQITTVIALPNGMPSPKADTEVLSFDIEAWDEAVLQKLPEWVQDKIKQSTEYKKLHTPTDEVDFEDEPNADASANAPTQTSAAGGAHTQTAESSKCDDLPFTVGEECPI